MRLSHLTLLHKGQASTRYYRWMTRSWSPAPSSSSPSSSLSSSQQWAPALHHHSLCHLNLLQVRRVGLGSVLCHYCTQQVESASITIPIIIIQHFPDLSLRLSHCKNGIRYSSQISTTAPIFLLSYYFRQEIFAQFLF